MTRKIRNWATFYRTQESRSSRALAEGQHRPPPMVLSDSGHTAPEAQQATEDTDQEDDRD